MTPEQDRVKSTVLNLGIALKDVPPSSIIIIRTPTGTEYAEKFEYDSVHGYFTITTTSHKGR